MTSALATVEPPPPAVKRRSALAWTGIVAGVLALGIALLLPRVLPVLVPPPPIEQKVMERAKSLRDRAMAIIKGTESKAPEPAAPKATDWRTVGGITSTALGYVAFVLGVLGFVRREDPRVVAGAGLFGVSGLAFEQAIVAALMLFAVVVVVLVIDRRSAR